MLCLQPERRLTTLHQPTPRCVMVKHQTLYPVLMPHVLCSNQAGGLHMQVVVQLMGRLEEAAQQSRELSDESDKLQVRAAAMLVTDWQ